MRIRLLAGAAALALAGCSAGSTAALPSIREAATPKAATPEAATPMSASARPADPDAGMALIKTATWTSNSKGRQLQVVPTGAGRTDHFPTAIDRAWAEVLRKAPDAGSPGMHDQFRCHWDYARVVEPAKPSWNLEPWRPAVGYARTVAALCNPGGAEG